MQLVAGASRIKKPSKETQIQPPPLDSLQVASVSMLVSMRGIMWVTNIQAGLFSLFQDRLLHVFGWVLLPGDRSGTTGSPLHQLLTGLTIHESGWMLPEFTLDSFF